MKILLDIDGVMVKAIPHKQPEFEDDGFYKFTKDSVIILNLFLEEEGSEIILTTTHRFNYTIEEWEDMFARRGITPVPISRIEAIPMGSKKDMIENWITEEGIEDYLIIDDDTSLRGLPDEMKKDVILTNPYYGLVYCGKPNTDLYR